MLYLLKQAIAVGADDTFIISSFPPAFKVDGKLTPQFNDRLNPDQAKLLVYAIMNDKQKRQYEAEKECNFAIAHPDGGRFRVNAYLEQGKPAMVLRKINTKVPTLTDLKLPQVLADIAMERKGLVLVVGQTGSGKSTTLAAMIDYRNKNSHGHILSIEDPVEFVHFHQNCIVSQREVGVDTDSWQNAIKSALRQAPNVVLIGEIRDHEAMEYALQFAETGHLCVATIHATNTIQAIERIVNLFPAEKHHQVYMNLSLNLKAIIGQRLIPLQTGKGRAAAIEIMLNTSTIADYIFKRQLDPIRETMVKSRDLGMQTFDQALFDLYEAEQISYEESLKNADSLNDVKMRIRLESVRAKKDGAADSTMNETMNLKIL
ncbi:type IV pili twitching motility protein PilT [Aquella oligotrophica]|uniref:Type IV pili twitching motility protein PilT n=2 Tax=Aquella oligotrophica TaxID=2067065 RepID=A0A2I7N9L0_9NEIS|nr:type IV pili twitching motility protein PilT [Aquella oligotrophica]